MTELPVSQAGPHSRVAPAVCNWIMNLSATARSISASWLRLRAESSTFLADLALVVVPELTPLMFSATPAVPVCAVWMLRVISWVAAPCCSTAAAMAPETWSISWIVAAMLPIAVTPCWVCCCTAATWAEISSVALAVWLARFLTSLATTAKPLPALAGAGRLDGGVERQQVGLAGDVVDQLDHVADLGSGAGHVLDQLIGGIGLGGGVARDGACAADLGGDFAARRRQLLRCRRHGLDIGGRFLAGRRREPGQLSGLLQGGGHRLGIGFEIFRRLEHGFDHFDDLAAEFVDQLALGLRRLLLGGGIGLGFLVELAFPQQCVAEHQQGARHGADLVAPGDSQNVDIEFALGQRRHIGGQVNQRPGNLASDDERDATDNDGDDQDHQSELDRGGAVRGIDIVGIDAGADDPTPGCEAGDVGQFRHRFRGARFRTDKTVEAGAAFSDDFHHVAIAVRAIGRGDVAGRLALEFGQQRMHQHGGSHVEDPVIVAVAVAHGAQFGQRRRLRGGFGEVPGFDLRLVAGDHGLGALGQSAQLDLAGVEQAPAQVEQGDRSDDRQADKCRADNRPDLAVHREVVEPPHGGFPFLILRAAIAP